MKIGFVQYDVTRDGRENFDIVQKHITSMDCEIVVLPELCDCGYLFEDRNELNNLSKPINENAFVDNLKLLSAQKGCTIVSGVAERDGGKIYNSSVIIENGIIRGVYRKIHLSDFEKKLFDSGDANTVFEANGIKIGVQICFDLWFPEISREQVRQGADLLCVLANFGGETTYDISRIRAIENLTPLILCNRIGREQNSTIEAVFLGRSTIIDRDGNRLFKGIDGIEMSQVCDVPLLSEKANVICGDFFSEMSRHYDK